MIRSLALNLPIACVLLLPVPLRAQTAPAPGNTEREVRQVVERMFDAMRAGDSAAMRPLFHPQARLLSVGRRNDAPVINAESIDAFLAAVGTPRPEVLDERISDVEVRVDGNLATAWMNYSFYLGERFSHCGVNAFQFFRGTQGWQVIQITDTRRREGCGEGAR